MKAKLVTAAITVRVIVPDDATEADIIVASKINLFTPYSGNLST